MVSALKDAEFMLRLRVGRGFFSFFFFVVVIMICLTLCVLPDSSF